MHGMYLCTRNEMNFDNRNVLLSLGYAQLIVVAVTVLFARVNKALNKFKELVIFVCRILNLNVKWIFYGTCVRNSMIRGGETSVTYRSVENIRKLKTTEIRRLRLMSDCKAKSPTQNSGTQQPFNVWEKQITLVST